MKKIMDGNSAVAEIAYKFSEVASIYPITPSSPMASGLDARRSRGEVNLLGGKVDVIEMQSEAGAAGAMHGALLSGALASTFTASQGLLLMIPNMYKMAGEGLPGVIHVASRTIATHALSIFGDHSDVYATRSTGFCMLSSSSVQEAHDMAAVAHLSSIKSSLPFLHFMDGFRTSHEINKIDVLEDTDLAKLLDRDAINDFRNKSLNINRPKSRGMAENEDIYFQSVEARNRDYEAVSKIVEDYMNKINSIQKTDYKPFNYYGAENAKFVIVAMGSVASIIKETIDKENQNGGACGLVTVHLYRPFSKELFLKVLPQSTKRIAVLDRTKEAGSIGEPLYLDVVSVLKDTNIDVFGGRYGLSSKNTTPKDIHAVFKMLEENPKDNFTIGIIDDVTNTSLKVEEFQTDVRTKELVVYGFGSDGMVSACKDMLHIVGENTPEYVQGYFEYDSKKSGGVTISHLRFSKEKIDMPYYPEHPNIVVVTKDLYLNKFDVINNIGKNGVLIVNSSHKFDEIKVKASTIKILKERKITVFTIDAARIANRNGLKGKISVVFETILLKLLGIKNYENILNSTLEDRFKTKGKDIIEANKKCVREALVGLVPFRDELKEGKEEKNKLDVIDIINARRGNELKVSDLIEYRNGEFPDGLSKLEKRRTSDSVPIWKSEACIQCGMCSMICPHAVIRPFILDKDDPKSEEGISLIGENDKYKYLISVSEADCTGCGLCVSVCPGKGGEKALVMGSPSQKKQRLANTLFNFYKNPQVFDKYTIKGSQLEKPKFEFSGACSGCGETPYIKLLTQLFGDRLIIANATGCSSIYGGSVPTTPYSIPWANSLFEDNAEFGFGILSGYKNIQRRIREIMEECKSSSSDVVRELYETWINNIDDIEATKKVRKELEGEEIPREIKDLLDYLVKPSIWSIGGDGWAYDIGFGGIDHVLSSNENINILVLDTEVYSNTGGQASKSSHLGQVAEFADSGKKTEKKDLFRIAMGYNNVYVASVNLGANMFQTLKAFKEAEEHEGPSIIIAYSPCIEQGIKRGMGCSNLESKKAVSCGYSLLMRYKNGVLTVDSAEPDFEKYEDFLDGEIRYNALKISHPEVAYELLDANKKAAMKRYEFYK
ncbi:MAG TPA: pyruvate:ferredoxin (flavodoxin) oxidoreductase, partial [Firmicutes bacterium]|nr:pyruvate:ferredoxin (flavodoxin) oxidoreductase [Bacillota bacterium]